MSARRVAVLFAMSDSNYKAIDGCDVFDIERDARTFDGVEPVIAHPPCRAWGRLRHFAKPRLDEKDLALFAVEKVRANGGVLEHPAASSLWVAADLPSPGCGIGVERDSFGGFSVQVLQFWWGHRAAKSTWFYIVGCNPADMPVMPLVLGEAPCTVGLYSGRDRARCRKEVSKRERESTPPDLCRWLVDLAARCAV